MKGHLPVDERAAEASAAEVMRLRIVIDDLSGPEIAEFLDEHIAEMRATSPPESKHALDLDGLRRPEVTARMRWSLPGPLAGLAVVLRLLRSEVGSDGGEGHAECPGEQAQSVDAGTHSRLAFQLGHGGDA